MSVAMLLVANCPLPAVEPEEEYPLHVDLDRGIIEDGGAEDNFYLIPFEDTKHYTGMDYGVLLEWPQYTPGRAQRILAYIKQALEQTERVELWQVWLSEDEVPEVYRATCSMDECSPEDIRQLEQMPVWDLQHPERPRYYCLSITRDKGKAAG